MYPLIFIRDGDVQAVANVETWTVFNHDHMETHCPEDRERILDYVKSLMRRDDIDQHSKTLLEEFLSEHTETLPAGSIRMRCLVCRSEDVSREASVTWNTETQSWELSELEDGYYCHTCGDDTGVEERQV